MLSPEIIEEMKPWTAGNYPVWTTPGDPFPLIVSPLYLTGNVSLLWNFAPLLSKVDNWVGLRVPIRS